MPATPTTSPWRRPAVLATAAALVLGACASEAGDDMLAGGSSGGGGAPPVPGDVQATFDEAIDATRSVGSAEIEFDLGAESPMGTFGVSLAGNFDRDDVGVTTASTDGDVDSMSYEIRSDGVTAWITSDAPQILDELPDGVTWVEAPVDDLRDTGVFTGLDTTFDVLPVLRGIDEVDDAGTDTVEGVPVRLLDGEVDWDEALDAASADERAGLEETISISDTTDITEFTATVGLDPDNRVRRLVLDVTAGAATDQDDGGLDVGEILLHLEFEVASFDHEVEVPEAPPADETVLLSEVPAVEDALAEGL